MSVLEPVAAAVPRDTAADLPDAGVAEVVEVGEVTTEAPPAHDHVRSHPATCYWDVRECRWECSDR